MNTKRNYQDGTPTNVPENYKINIVDQGPYLLTPGAIPIKLETIMTEHGVPYAFKSSVRSFQTGGSKPVALCRCGASKNKPYCDGSHVNLEWDSRLTASREPLLSDAEVLTGPTLILTDNKRYCAFARFCDAHGRTWNLTEESDHPLSRKWAIETASLCPSGRLMEWDRESGAPLEPSLEPSIGLIEDPEIGVSGPIWVKGGIPIVAPDGFTYQVRNRVTLCRCGNSSNKPFCDGTHVSSKFRDGLKDE